MRSERAALPRVVFREEWRIARKALLAKEKELARHSDAVSAERRRLPMVEIEKRYVFEGAIACAPRPKLAALRTP